MDASDPRTGWLREVQLANIRSFGQEFQTLRLVDTEGAPAQWTLILGNNGAGKSGLLLSVALGLHALKQDGVSILDVQGISLSGPSTTFPRPSTVILTFVDGRRREMTITRVVNGTAPPVSRIDLGNLLPEEKRSQDYPIALGYGPNRLSSEELRSLQESDWGIGHLLYLTNGLRSPSRLLVNNLHLLQTNRTELDFTKILSSALPDNITVGFEDSDAPSAFSERVPVYYTPTGPVPFAQLGYGYKTIVALVSDIASRLIEAYPNSPNALEESAICLIDELDLHLHPAWQRRLVKYLGETFVNTQFIATAHSPLMVQAAETANLALIHLSDEPDGSYRVSKIDNDVEHIRGWRLDQVVTSDLFGFESPYSPEVEAKVRLQDKLRAQTELTDQERADLESLDKDLEKLPPGETFEQAKALLKLSEDSLRLLEKSREANL